MYIIMSHSCNYSMFAHSTYVENVWSVCLSVSACAVCRNQHVTDLSHGRERQKKREKNRVSPSASIQASSPGRGRLSRNVNMAAK